MGDDGDVIVVLTKHVDLTGLYRGFNHHVFFG